jgi:alpha-beta hydrolase superfamily lysophospholipase
VLYLHGIQSHCGWYEQSAERLRQAGLAVLQPDRRGSGRNRRARGDADGPRQLIQDARCYLGELARRTGYDRNHVVGVSWGGKLAAALHVTDPSGIASLALVTPGLFPIVDVSPMDKLRIGWSMVSDRCRLFDIPLNDPELFTSDPTWIEWLRHDELQLHQATAGFFLASRRMDRTAHRLPGARAVPLNVFLAEDERIIDNALTRAFIRDLPWPEVTLTTYTGVRHTLEFDAKAEEYFDDLAGWITAVNASRCRAPAG